MSDKKYFELPIGVRIANTEPIDGDRYIASTIAVRGSLITAGRAHEGLQVFVEADKKLYILKTLSPPDWVEIGVGTDGDKHLEFSQVTASDTWTIDHTLGKFPSIMVVGADKKSVICEIEYDSITRVILRFNATFIGRAFLN